MVFVWTNVKCLYNYLDYFDKLLNFYCVINTWNSYLTTGIINSYVAVKSEPNNILPGSVISFVFITRLHSSYFHPLSNSSEILCKTIKYKLKWHCCWTRLRASSCRQVQENKTNYVYDYKTPIQLVSMITVYSGTTQASSIFKLIMGLFLSQQQFYFYHPFKNKSKYAHSVILTINSRLLDKMTTRWKDILN